MVRTDGDVPLVGSSEFTVLRLKKRQCNITPETLMVFLRSAPVQNILKWCQKGSQHPRFSEGDLGIIYDRNHRTPGPPHPCLSVQSGLDSVDSGLICWGVVGPVGESGVIRRDKTTNVA